MRLRFTLFLLVANLAVFGFIWNNAREQNRERPPLEMVFPIDANSIRLTAAGDEADSYSLALVSGRWMLEKPYAWPANPWAVQKILDELRNVSRDQGFPLVEVEKLGNSLASYGLDAPKYTLTVTAGAEAGAARRDITVKVGSLTPDGNSVYLLSQDGASILIAPSSLIGSLAKTPADLRDPEVFSIPPFEVRSVSMTSVDSAGQKTTLGLVRDRREVPGSDEPEFIWRFETPVKSDANTVYVEKELSLLGELRYVRFLPATPELLETAGFSSPRMTLSLVGNNRRQTLLIGAPDASSKGVNVYAKFDDNPVIFTIPASSLNPWLSARRTMRDPNFLRFDPSALTGVTIHEGGNSLVLHRIDAPAAGNGKSVANKPEWQMPLVPGSTAIEDTPVDEQARLAMERALLNLVARDFSVPSTVPADARFLCEAFVTDEPTPAQLKEWGLAKDSAYKRRVELAFRDGTRRVLTIGAPLYPNTPLHAKLDEAPSVFSIAPGVLDHLSASPSAYRRRDIFPEPAGARLVSMKIEDLMTGKTLLDETRPDDVPAWESLLASRSGKDRQDVLLLAAMIGRLRAQRFIDADRRQVPFTRGYVYDDGSGTSQFRWRYRLTWTVKLPAGAEGERVVTHELYLTRRIGGMTQIAGSPELNLVFALPQDWIDMLHPLTFGRDSSADLPPMPAPEAAGAAPVLYPGF